MARPKHRLKAPGAYFVTAETWQWRELFKKETAAKILIETLLDCRQHGFYRLHDFVVMPDHLHLILTPQQYPYSSANGRFALDPFTMPSGAKAQVEAATATAGLKPRPAKTWQEDR